MPITHRFDEHIMLLTESAVGLVTLDDFLSNLAKVEARLPNNVVFLNLSDYRYADFSGLSAADISTMKSAANQMLIRRSSSSKTAALVVEGNAYGLARMYSMVGDNPEFQFKVFTDKQAAENWLGIRPNVDFVTGYEILKE